MINVKQTYLKLFDSFLDNNVLNTAFIISSSKLSQTDKLEILEHLSYRLQIEFDKTVIFITNKNKPSGEIDFINKETEVCDIPLNHCDRNKYVFIIDVDLPYFDKPNCWENRVIQTLIYYKYTLFGFSSDETKFKFYENI